MDGELAKDGADNVRIEDVGLGTFFREAFDGLGDASVDPLRIGRERQFMPLLVRLTESRRS